MGVKNRNLNKPYDASQDSKYKIKTIDVEIAVANLFDFRKYIIVPNISWGFHFIHECDLFLVSKSNYCYEVEIKVSKADFLKDFEKKHNHSSNYIKEFYYAMPETLYEKVKDMIPEHAGAITCKYSYGKVRAKIVKESVSNKNAKKISLEDELKILRLATMRIWSLKDKINNKLKKQIMFNKLKREELELEKKITQQNHELEIKQIALNFALNFVHKANFDTNEVLIVARKAEQFLNGK